MYKPSGFLLLALAASSMLRAGDFRPSEASTEALTTITEHTIMPHIRFLSHDLLEGRAPGTRGDALARLYIAAQMEEMGLQPGAENGTWFQRVPVLSMTTDPAFVLSIRGKGGNIDLQYRTEFIGNAGNQQPLVDIRDAGIVFVGYGIVAPEQEWDDYKGTDLRGKILLMLNNDPSPDDPAVFGGKGRQYYGRWDYKFQMAAKKGAAGAIIIHTTESAGYGWNVVESSWTGEQFELAKKPDDPGSGLNAWTTFAATERILALAGLRYDDLFTAAQKRSFTPVDLGLTLSTVITTTMQDTETTNVLGLLPGSDPQLKGEVVVLTAHYDHLGIGTPVNGDSINNGALDNATGVGAVLSIAQAFRSMTEAPRRSVLFAAVGAEESGLLGSQYYTRNPTFPPGRIAANINIDGLGIFGRTKDVSMVGLGKSSVDDVVRTVVTWQGRVLKPDQYPELGLFYRSDQFNFARIGVPCVYLDPGLEYIDKPADFGKKKVEEYIEKNYHRPSDEITGEWELSGGVEDTRLMFLVAQEIANADDMPQWNKGDEFESVRAKAIRDSRTE
jgi:Zn-dependent M28 family amino/carboxypeptidase